MSKSIVEFGLQIAELKNGATGFIESNSWLSMLSFDSELKKLIADR